MTVVQPTGPSQTAEGSGSGSPAALQRLWRTASLPAAWVAAVRQAAKDAYALYHPENAPTGKTPADKGLETFSAKIETTRDNLLLDAWVVPGEGPNTVVICHGMSRTKAMVIDHIRLLNKAGYHVVAYDLRNHGASGRSPATTDMANRFTSDLCDVLRFVREDARLGTAGIATMGFSFSTWGTVYSLLHTEADVSAIICESGPMFNIPSGFAHFSNLRRSTLPEPLQQPSAFGLYRATFRTTANRMCAVKGWPPPLPPTVPMMFIAGAEDRMIRASQIISVAEQYPHADWWVAPNSLHMNAIRLDRDEYKTRVLDFLSSAFAARSAQLAAA